MGISGLIPFVEKATRKVTLKELKGKTVAIDSYCWLHKGAICCSELLARNQYTDLHIQYCLKYVNLLLTNGVKPILVFDGKHLPAKSLTEKRRRESRTAAKIRAKELLREGKTSEARNYLNKGIDITHEMALELIKECRKRNVDCIVAPYEADGQLAFLNREGFAEYVLTEDSDLILFGCSKIIFKFDLSGQGLLFEADNLPLTMNCKVEKYTFDRFLMMCILSGCDYLDSLRGVGLAKACKFVLMTEESDIKKSLSKIPSYLNLKNVTVEEEYKENFMKAWSTFRHMIVYNPRIRRQRHLIEPNEEELKYCANAGSKIDEETAFQLAIGNIDPFSMKKLDDWSPDELNTDKYPSIWGGSLKRNQTIKKFTVQSQNPVFTAPLEVNKEEKVNSEDILGMYLKPKERDQSPEPKRQKLTEITENVSFVTRSRNPFLKSKTDNSNSTEDLSTTPLSLLKKISPVKKISSKFSLQKLSKFKRTTVTDKDVIVKSKFFGKFTQNINNNESDINISVSTSTQLKINESESNSNDSNLSETNNSLSLNSDLSPKPTQHDSKDEENENCLAVENEEQETEDLFRTSSQERDEKTPERSIINRSPDQIEEIVVEPEIQLESSQKENEIIILSETESPRKTPKKPKLDKKKSFQSKLSAFGFQKK